MRPEQRFEVASFGVHAELLQGCGGVHRIDVIEIEFHDEHIGIFVSGDDALRQPVLFGTQEMDGAQYVNAVAVAAQRPERQRAGARGEQREQQTAGELHRALLH